MRSLGMTKGMLEGLDGAAGAGAPDGLRVVLAAHGTGEGVLFGSRAWLVTASRR